MNNASTPTPASAMIQFNPIMPLNLVVLYWCLSAVILIFCVVSSVAMGRTKKTPHGTKLLSLGLLMYDIMFLILSPCSKLFPFNDVFLIWHATRGFQIAAQIIVGCMSLERLFVFNWPYEYLRLRSHRNIRYTLYGIRYTRFGIRYTLYGHGGSHRSSTCCQCALFVSMRKSCEFGILKRSLLLLAEGRRKRQYLRKTDAYWSDSTLKNGLCWSNLHNIPESYELFQPSTLIENVETFLYACHYLSPTLVSCTSSDVIHTLKSIHLTCDLDGIVLSNERKSMGKSMGTKKQTNKQTNKRYYLT